MSEPKSKSSSLRLTPFPLKIREKYETINKTNHICLGVYRKLINSAELIKIFLLFNNL